jgi:hypothetical protein
MADQHSSVRNLRQRLVHSRLLSGQFFCSTQGRFSVPTCLCSVTPRAAAVKDGPLGPPPEAARSVLDGGEHGVTLAAVGTAVICARSAV